MAPSLTDLTTGMWGGIAVLAALRRRDESGVGEHVEATLVDSGFALLCHQIVGMFATGTVPGPLGSASPITAPYECFRTRDGWVMIAAGNDGLFSRLCVALGAPELLQDDRFAGSAARVLHRDLLHAAVQERVARYTTASCLEHLRAAGVPVGPVHDLREAVEHPVATERGTVVRRPPAGDGATGLPLVRLPVDDATTPQGRPPGLGEQSVEILRGAGFHEDAIARLTSHAPG